ncbi:hypothetical protein QET93_011785 [Akkermansia sp. N21116]|jgi:sugar lactone lactonase YvrE|uniref:SMP-30/gluconolactonase/LRE family protein n=1 Tax=Akkermansia sp. N21116 TaxID=3040764 RepID=UPI00244EFD93|nr:hypothetical protein [Akkermansia sp. N21116]WPX40209.1 hypothetical protein QET93_011785 [Akkermansia sp. N21116]
MKNQYLLLVSALGAVLVSAGCSSLPESTNAVASTQVLPPLSLKPQMFVNLDPATCSVPDGMSVAADGSIILSAPNYIDYEKVGGSKLFRIDKNRNVSIWFDKLTPHPDTGKVHPMGIEFGPDGNLYIADNQYFNDKNYKSRLLRIVVENGKPVRCEVAASGFKLANAVRWHNGKAYVSDTHFDLPGKPNQSGVYAISLDEMKKGEVKLLPNASDPHLVAQYDAKPSADPQAETDGADGVTFDNQGRMYSGRFGDGVISRTTFSASGKPLKQEIIVDDPSINCCDGIVCDRDTNKIYVTNSKRNSIHMYDVDKSTFRIISENGNTTGAGGKLDQPCEPLVIGDELIIVNFDMPFPGMKNTKHDLPIGLSVIKLDK